MDIVVVGAGRVGTALAILLSRAGHRICGVSGREATAARANEHLPGALLMQPEDAARLGELILLTVPDDALPSIVERIAGSVTEGRWVVHTSGASGLEVLAPVLVAGGRRLAMHPLQTFPDVAAAVETIPGCTAAVTADDEEGHSLGESLANDLGAHPFRLADEMRPLYHAAAVFASNYLVTVSGLAERLFEEAGVRDPVGAMHPLQRATLTNVGSMGPTAALTGPAVRGDAGTIQRNLKALRAHAPDAVKAYVVLCRATLDVAGERLPPDRRAAVEEVLDRWT